MARYIDADKWPDLGMYDTTDLAEMLAQFDTVSTPPRWVRVDDELPPKVSIGTNGDFVTETVLAFRPTCWRMWGYFHKGIDGKLTFRYADEDLEVWEEMPTHWLKGLELPEVDT